ncbi:MAG TPA: sugar ABC transporter substrate-binding protein [Microterricola sp.]|uniref:ABC transporter substrate-binding protein n=1 Tax=Leifsonia sp. Root4 TaxID=1736525 RepID=UPI0006F665CD|nr:sugar ABC transporter substrate-binding protein [Leifsonia sp. Root4]KQW05599.1 hypothetical protein ASC66_11495 [Leifsonia sp. Root4]
MKRSLRRFHLYPAAAATAAAALLLAGCSAAAPGSDLGPIDDPQAVAGTVTVLTWEGANTALEAIVPAFEEEYPNLKVDLQVIGYDDVSTRLTVGLQSGADLPDVVAVTGERVKTVTENFPEGFVDLSVFGLDERQDEWADSKWPALTGPDVQLFGVPWDVAPVALYYRTDLFEAAGIDAASIHTWDDYLAAGDLLARDGYKLFPIEVDTSQAFSILLQQQGESYFTDDGESNLASDAAIETATRLQSAVDGGYAEIVNNWDAMLASLKSGDVATHIMPVWFAGILEGAAPELEGKWGVIELPAAEAGGVRASNQGGSNLLIPAKSKNPEGGYLFATFALGEASSANTMMELGNMSSLLAASSEPAFTTDVPYYGGQKVWQLFASTISDIPAVPLTADYDKADQIVIDAIGNILVSGADPRSTLKDASAQLTSQID